ncbi:itaconate degradation C-C-lyase RipC [Beijerinckia indica]|uniref:Citryl-CoA lyase n=1 Tax=Beijerinckia indica subsp. indica (strain ATCC 9039 / DSM 1715 / NCIMB 8712) TaxID=395963 RepID=B2IIS4_BEII9|nr:itaconate degradation C-C-lyase RipC [Beijerinckia indica]ACB96136.1 Citryl-CoA lyase [Beijerinckia indica subsp. indica ATCC 9039]
MVKPTRSWLFTPGTRPDRFAKAAEAGADVLIIDLEDAVAQGQKAEARASVLSYFAHKPSESIARAIRINGLDTVHGLADLHAVIEDAVDADFLILPKTESADHILILDRLLSRVGIRSQLVGLIESARGLTAVDKIAAASPRLHGLMLGAADMAADLGAGVSWDNLSYIRGRFVVACANARIAAIDSPWFDVRDEAGLIQEVRRAVGMGFVAKAAIHPGQVKAINTALTPTAEEVQLARAILVENEKGVGVINGKMIDEAIARKARRVLAAAGG